MSSDNAQIAANLLIAQIAADKIIDADKQAHQDSLNQEQIRNNNLKNDALNRQNQEQAQQNDSLIGKNNRLKKELKTIKNRLSQSEDKIIEQHLAYDEAFLELINEFGYSEEEKTKIKKQHLRWQVRAEQIIQKKEQERLELEKFKENEPKKLDSFELNTLELWKAKELEQIPDFIKNQIIDIRARHEYWINKEKNNIPETKKTIKP